MNSVIEKNLQKNQQEPMQVIMSIDDL